MRIFNKFIESKKEPSNKNDIWFDGSVFRIYKEEAWKAFTVNLNDANEIAKLKDELYEFLYDEAKPTVEEAKQAAATIQEYVDKAIDALVLAQQSLANSESAITEATALKSQTEQLIEQGNIVVENANKATDNANETSSNIKAIWDDLFVEINNSIASANEAADRANNSIVFYPISDEDVSIIMGNLPRTDSFVEEYTGHTYVYNNKYGLWYLTSDLSICIAVPSIQSYNIEDEGKVFIQNINYIYNSETNRYERQGLYGKLPIRLLWDGLEEFGGQKEALFTNDGGHNILLKTKQQLADSEKNQVKENLGITDYDDAEIKQELTELSEEIEHQDILIDDLQENKADKDGIYSGMTVGRSIDLLGVEDVEEGSFLFRPTDGDGSIKDGVAVVKSVKGDSVVWNQLYNRTPLTISGMTTTIDGNTTIINGVTTTSYFNIQMGVRVSANKMLMVVQCLANPDGLSFKVADLNSAMTGINVTASVSNGYGFYTGTYRANGNALGIQSFGGVGTAFNNVKIVVSLYDLTKMFGVGNEPSTIEEFNARVATLCIEDMNAYNEGEVVNMKASAIKSVGFNAWDEEWEVGKININDGSNINTTSEIRSKNYSKVLPSTEYYIETPNTIWIAFLEYDADKNYLRNRGGLYGKIKTSPDCHYLRFYVANSYGTTYNHDICINLVHSGYRNGEYEPYVEDVLALPTLDLFPNGMNRIGDVYDEYDSEKSVQRIGIRPYQSGDESIENVLTDGTSTLYVLEEPIVTPHDYRLAYKAWDFGTEQVIADGNTTAMTAGIIYEFNARDTIRSNKTRLDVLEPIVAGKIDKNADDYYPQLAVGLADNLAGVDVVDSEINFRRSGGGAISDGVARIEAIKGNSVVWNQGFKKGSSLAGTWDENILTINGTIASDANSYDVTTYDSVFVAPVANHKYYINLEIMSGTIVGDLVYVVYPALPYTRVVLNNSNKVYQGIIGQIDATIAYWFIRTQTTGSEYTNVKVRHVVYDLTQMFGAGNEPTTIEEFYSRIPMGIDLNAYNEGEVIHMDVQSIESQGVNAWDEEWEIGEISFESGGILDNKPNSIRCVNFQKAISGATYFRYNAQGKNTAVLFYDKDYNFISGTAGNNNTCVAPKNAVYFKVFTAYGSTYSHDICINLSDTSINGKYFPYIKRVEDLSIIRKYFPQGMKSAGSAHDEIRYNKATQKWEMVKKIGEAKMSDLKWYYNNGFFYSTTKANDIAKVSSWMLKANILSGKYTTIDANSIAGSGVTLQNLTIGSAPNGNIYIVNTAYTDVNSLNASFTDDDILYYELAEPIVTELDAEDQFKDLDYQVWNCGTEKAIAKGISAPLAADITYGFNAIGKIKELEEAIKALQTKVASL